MSNHPVIQDLAEDLIKSADRYAAHQRALPVIEQICEDRDILHTGLRHSLADPSFLNTARNLSIPLFLGGDVMLTLNQFVPIRDGGKDISHDNIHHHGWRLLTTGVVCGDGYETINFTHNSHLDRDGDKVNLAVEEVYRHEKGAVRFIDSNRAHIVFHPATSCTTLAVWSADRILTNQGIKRRLTNFPKIRKAAVKTIHTLGLNEALGLNPLKGLYYHPEGGKIVETQNYSKPFDGEHEEILRCMFRFFQQVDFVDPDFWQGLKPQLVPEAAIFVDQLVAGETIPDLGIWGNIRRRFSKTQILQALDHAHPGDVILS